MLNCQHPSPSRLVGECNEKTNLEACIKTPDLQESTRHTPLGLCTHSLGGPNKGELLSHSVILITHVQTCAKMLLQREEGKQSKSLKMVIRGWLIGNDLRVKPQGGSLQRQIPEDFFPEVLENWREAFLLMVRRETYYGMFTPG